ncbi:hypothetical protein OSB04_031855 [Centaurea solstitialis]|uniref:GAG-pre-integrase domain-containing protein n=1 Tax=Centaurea solstitialis TaxID=347529 RepID=A0AA38VUS1_9ASTR|nr:hypothetical protein OSB04_031855 [Centaurea solstitialis]
MTGTLELLSSYMQQEGSSVAFKGNQKRKIKGYGMIVKGEVRMNQVSNVDGLKHNLITMSHLCDNGMIVMFKIKCCIMYKTNTLIEVMRANRRGDLYLICFNTLKAKEEICHVSSVKNEEAWLWHTRFCHLNFHTLDKLVRLKLIKGLVDIKLEKDHLCSACEMGKRRTSSHKTKSDPSNDMPLQMLHVDLCGPISVQSLVGNKLQALHGFQVRVLRSDNGTKFKNSVIKEYQPLLALPTTSQPQGPLNRMVVSSIFMFCKSKDKRCKEISVEEQVDKSSEKTCISMAMNSNSSFMSIGSQSKPPTLCREEFQQWKICMVNFLEGIHPRIAEFLHNPPFVHVSLVPRVPASAKTDEVPEYLIPKPKKDWDEEEREIASDNGYSK